MAEFIFPEYCYKKLQKFILFITALLKRSRQPNILKLNMYIWQHGSKNYATLNPARATILKEISDNGNFQFNICDYFCSKYELCSNWCIKSSLKCHSIKKYTLRNVSLNALNRSSREIKMYVCISELWRFALHLQIHFNFRRQ